VKADLVSSQRSVQFWGDDIPPRGRRVFERFETFYGSMFSQDLGSIVPYRDDEFRVEILPKDDESTRKLVAEALNTERHRSLEDAVAEFMRHFCAPMVVLAGEAAYEIVFLQDSQGEDVAFRLSPVTPGTYRRFLGRYTQAIPREYAKAHQLPRRIWLKGKDVALFRLARRQRLQMEAMGRVFQAAQRRHEALADLTERAQKEHLPYDFKAHQDLIDRVVARATSPVGWDARGTFREKQLEPYVIYRHLRFASLKAELRQTIMDQLNEVLGRVGERFGQPIQLLLHGLPSLRDIEEAESQLREGSRPLTDLLTAYL
jgi:hypothetical protein